MAGFGRKGGVEGVGQALSDTVRIELGAAIGPFQGKGGGGAGLFAPAGGGSVKVT